MQPVVIYTRYKKTTTTTTRTTAIKCLRRHIACKAICATRVLQRYEPGKNLISIDILIVQAKDKEPTLGSPVILERPFIVSFRQDMTYPGNPKVAAKQHKYSKHVQKNIDLSSRQLYCVFRIFVISFHSEFRCLYYLFCCSSFGRIMDIFCPSICDEHIETIVIEFFELIY